MRQQFFYTRKEPVGGTKEAPIYRECQDSFNINAVIRSITMADGTVLVLLNDIHERTTEAPAINPRTNKPTGAVTRRRDAFQSEIYLSTEDGERFQRLCSIVEPIRMDVEVLHELTKETNHGDK